MRFILPLILFVTVRDYIILCVWKKYVKNIAGSKYNEGSTKKQVALSLSLPFPVVTTGYGVTMEVVTMGQEGMQLL